MSVRCIRDNESFQKLQPYWNALLQQSQSNTIFLTWEWVSTWWEIFGRDFQMRILVEEQNGKIRGIAPLMIGRDRGTLNGHFRPLLIIGQRGETLAEHLDFFIQTGCESEVTGAFCEYIDHELSADWDYIFFERMLSGSPNLHWISFFLKQKGYPVEFSGELVSPYIQLPTSWEELMHSQSRNFRNQWNNSWNRLAKQGDIRLLFAGKDLPVSTALDDVARLHRARWGNRSQSFCSEKYLQFHRNLSETLNQNGWLLLILLSLGGRNVAARYDFIYANKIWCFQGGWDPKFDRERAGMVLTGKILEWGIENGIPEYDFLGGNADYKFRWATGERKMIDLKSWNRKTVRGHLWNSIQKMKNMARTFQSAEVPHET